MAKPEEKLKKTKGPALAIYQAGTNRYAADAAHQRALRLCLWPAVRLDWISLSAVFNPGFRSWGMTYDSAIAQSSDTPSCEAYAPLSILWWNCWPRYLLLDTRQVVMVI